MATGLTLSDVGELLIDQKVSQPRQFRKAILESLLSSFRGILLSQFLSFDGQIDPLLNWREFFSELGLSPFSLSMNKGVRQETNKINEKDASRFEGVVCITRYLWLCLIHTWFKLLTLHKEKKRSYRAITFAFIAKELALWLQPEDGPKRQASRRGQSSGRRLKEIRGWGRIVYVTKK